MWYAGSSKIEYYQEEEKETLIKVFTVAKVFDVPARGWLQRKCRIDLFNADFTRVLCLNAPSQAAKQRWLDELQKAAEAPDLSAHPRYSEFRGSGVVEL